jgi:glutamate racemase
MNDYSIGIFDSGIGGLTVVKEIYIQFPKISTIYVGDTARVPYGNRSRETVIKFSSQIVEFLLKQNVQAIIVACSTATAQALPALEKKYAVPIFGVIEPAAITAAKQTKNNRIGVVGTQGTITSQKFNHFISQQNPIATTFSQACPLFVPLIEEGMLENDITTSAINYYFDSFIGNEFDTLILGCTHYPLITKAIQKKVGDTVRLINPGKELALSLHSEKNFTSNIKTNDKHKWFVTDAPDTFTKSANRFLQLQLNIKPEKINFD